MDLEKECRTVRGVKSWRIGVEKEEFVFLTKSKKFLSIKRRSDFKRIYHKGRRVFSSLLIVCALWNKMRETRIGISASKKVGCAVERNRVRRIIKEACLHMNISMKKDIVIIAKPSVKYCKMQDVWRDLCFLLKKIKNL